MNKVLMGILVLGFSGFQLQAQVQNYQPLGILARCQVVQISGSISSYLPPRVGDILVIDTRRPLLNEITFQSRNMIPLLAVLKRLPANQYTTHLATYQYETRTPTGAVDNATLQIGRFSDSQIQMTIQKIHRSSVDSLWSSDQIKLNCRT